MVAVGVIGIGVVEDGLPGAYSIFSIRRASPSRQARRPSVLQDVFVFQRTILTAEDSDTFKFLKKKAPDPNGTVIIFPLFAHNTTNCTTIFLILVER